MTVAEFMSTPLSEALTKLNMVDCKVHTDDNGEVKAVEIKYRVKLDVKSIRKDPNPW